MKTCTIKLRAIVLALVFACVSAFCGFFMTACNKDNGGGENGDNSNVNAPENKPLSLTSSVVTNDSGENVYTINAIVNPNTLTPRWAIVWENSDSEWASGKNVNDYISLELSNGDKTAKLSTKQEFGETAILTATIGNGSTAVSVSKRVDYGVKLCYELVEGNSYTVVGFSDIYTFDNFGSALAIPNIYRGKPVTKIKKHAFNYNKSITSLVIPDNVVSIEGYTFLGCTSLKTVEVGRGLKSIGEDAFRGCSGLEGVYIKDLASWCNISFFNNTAPSYPVGYVSNLLSLAHNLYLNGSLVTVLDVSALLSISDYAFAGCTSLTSVRSSELGDLVTIGYGSFSNCTSLMSITIPVNVTFIDCYAFYRCSSLISAWFCEPRGWIAYGSELTLGDVNLNSNDLNNLSVAAAYLTLNRDDNGGYLGYCPKCWRRT